MRWARIDSSDQTTGSYERLPSAIFLDCMIRFRQGFLGPLADSARQGDPRLENTFLRALLICATCVCGAVGVCGQLRPRVVHVFVALADNVHQGIVPVPAALGNGDDPGRNLYWGAAYGVRTYFRKSAEWKEIAVVQNPSAVVLQRVVFYDASHNVYLVADAYQGREIKEAIVDFFQAAAGLNEEKAIHVKGANRKELEISSQPDLTVYVGHDGLMDFAIERKFQGKAGGERQAIVLACASKAYFGPSLRATGAKPILWTMGLMAPEAYTLKDAVDGWMVGETADQIRERAARAYSKYQKISMNAALRLFSPGW